MDFYRIDDKYIGFLQTYEKAYRGFSKVPNIHYSDRDKFSFGAVLKVNGMNYYVSVSSFDIQQEANILIRIPGDKKEIKGSLRFNFMIPVPDECINRLVIKDIMDEQYRLLLNKEYRFCKNNESKILEKAIMIYDMVVHDKKPKLTENSCDFKLLEKAYEEYVSENIRKDNT